jgi:hypothetical protein
MLTSRVELPCRGVAHPEPKRRAFCYPYLLRPSVHRERELSQTTLAHGALRGALRTPADTILPPPTFQMCHPTRRVLGARR